MKKYCLILLTLGIFLLVTQPALAQGILTTLQNRYDSATAGWMTRSLVYARNLFFLLAAIEIAVTSIFYLFQKEGIAEFFSGLLIKVLALLFFYTLLIQSPQWIPAIIQSFIKAGQGVGNIAVIDPSAVMGQGLTLAAAMLDGVKTASLWNSLGLIIIAGLSSLGVVLAYIVIAGQLFVTLIESYLVLGGGVLLLGFGGSRWGLPFVERFLGYVIAIGVKLLVLFLLISLGTTLVPQLSQVLAEATQSGLPQPALYLDLLASTALFSIVCWMIPSLSASLLSGSPGLSMGTVGNTALLSAAAAMTALNKTLSSISSNKPTGSTSLMEAAKIGTGERKGGLELSAIQPKQSGLNAVSPASSPAAETPRRGVSSNAGGPTDPSQTKPKSGSGLNTVTAPRLPDEGGHQASVSPRLNMPD